MIYQEYETRYQNLDYPRSNLYNERQEYRNQVALVESDFRQSLLDEYVCRELGVAAESRLWGLAWEQGHSSGYSEVENCYSELAELVNLV